MAKRVTTDRVALVVSEDEPVRPEGVALEVRSELVENSLRCRHGAHA
ncbi:MAG TPA: hypothetical protein VF855_14615 [Acidimicrobiales bacterium]